MTRKPTTSHTERKPGFYWVRFRWDLQKVQPAELCEAVTPFWRSIGRVDWHSESEVAEVLSDRIPPPTKRRASGKR